MVAHQYYPYDGGAGKIFWVKNSLDIEIPVLTVRYSLWKGANWPRGGSPDKVARLINKTATEYEINNKKSFGVVSVHAWSRFRDPKDSSMLSGPQIAQVCAEKLAPGINVVTLEELLWRIRMKHNPSQTKQLIGKHR